MVVRDAIASFSLGVGQQHEAMYRIAIKLAAFRALVAEVGKPPLGLRCLEQLGEAGAAVGNKLGGQRPPIVSYAASEEVERCSSHDKLLSRCNRDRR